MRIQHKILSWRLATMILAGASVPGYGASGESTVNFHGTLVTGICRAEVVDVNFGNVNINRIPTFGSQGGGATQAEQSFNIKVNCTGTLSGAVQLSVSGARASFSDNAIASSIADLGVMISTTDSAVSHQGIIVPDTWYTLSRGAGEYAFVAGLVKGTNASLSGGDFNATATLTIQIQ